MSDSTEEVRAYTIRLELVDKPGELLRALDPIAANGGNLLSIHHERGSVTPSGHIPVEVDLEATAEQMEQIVDGLRNEGINIKQAGTERYSEEVTVILVGHLISTDLSDTLSRIRDSIGPSVTDLSLASGHGEHTNSSARLRLATHTGGTEDALAAIRQIAAEKDLQVVEPLTGSVSA